MHYPLTSFGLTRKEDGLIGIGNISPQGQERFAYLAGEILRLQRLTGNGRLSIVVGFDNGCQLITSMIEAVRDVEVWIEFYVVE